jgi:hypothetical protein
MKQNIENWRLLKRLYAIHSPSGKETLMVKFIVSFIKSLACEITLGKDKHNNLYAVKGKAETYPCLVAHLDQVQQPYPKDYRAIETRDIIFGYSSKLHSFCGCGADDKNGIFIALEALKKYDCLKVAFFREEETGCIGSSNCEMSFFDNCRFVVQCDRRGNSDVITNIGSMDLCSEKFIQDINPAKYGYQETRGLMTDVESLKEQGLKVSAINLSCGYYNPHTDEEITVKQDLNKCWHFVQHIIEDCTDTYPHEADIYGGFGYGYTEWDLEEELFSFLQQDPTLTASDLYEMYQTNFPRLTLADYERIVAYFHMLYFDDEDEPLYSTDNEQKEAQPQESDSPVIDGGKSSASHDSSSL